MVKIGIQGKGNPSLPDIHTTYTTLLYVRDDPASVTTTVTYIVRVRERSETQNKDRTPDATACPDIDWSSTRQSRSRILICTVGETSASPEATASLNPLRWMHLYPALHSLAYPVLLSKWELLLPTHSGILSVCPTPTESHRELYSQGRVYTYYVCTDLHLRMWHLTVFLACQSL